MLIPLWLPWTVFIAAALFAVLGQESLPRYGRDPGRWAVALVALIVAVSLSVDRWQVKDDELFDAVSDASATMEGTVGAFSTEHLAVLVEARIGHEVEVERIDDEEDDDKTEYEVRVGDGAAACLEVYSATRDSGLPILDSLGVSSQGCE